MIFEKLYQLWCEHDLDKYTPEIYRNLKAKNRPLVWEIIENRYLKVYPELIRIEFEWSSTGIWRIPFPGSVTMGPNCNYSFLGLPEEAIAMLKEWHDFIDENAQPWNKDDKFDYDRAHEWGFEVTLKLRKYVPKEYYLEYHPFQEIVSGVSGQPLELDVPAEMVALCQ
jgi:hypothetical protein